MRIALARSWLRTARQPKPCARGLAGGAGLNMADRMSQFVGGDGSGTDTSKRASERRKLGFKRPKRTAHQQQ